MYIDHHHKESLLEIGLIVEKLGYNPEQSFEKQKEWEELNKLKIEYEQQLKEDSEQLLIHHFQHKYNMTPKQVVQKYIKNVNQLCDVGGYGHRFYYQGINGIFKGGYYDIHRCPDHWVVKPENYELAKPTQDQLMALHFYAYKKDNFKCSLSDVAKQEIWEN